MLKSRQRGSVGVRGEGIKQGSGESGMGGGAPTSFQIDFVARPKFVGTLSRGVSPEFGVRTFGECGPECFFVFVLSFRAFCFFTREREPTQSLWWLVCRR